jgi:hypothetical protein
VIVHVHQEAPRQQLGDTTRSTGDAMDGVYPSVVTLATTSLTEGERIIMLWIMDS